jgi:hypothetical protein
LSSCFSELVSAWWKSKPLGLLTAKNNSIGSGWRIKASWKLQSTGEHHTCTRITDPYKLKISCVFIGEIKYPRDIIRLVTKQPLKIFPGCTHLNVMTSLAIYPCIMCPRKRTSKHLLHCLYLLFEVWGEIETSIFTVVTRDSFQFKEWEWIIRYILKHFSINTLRTNQ